MRGAAKAGCGRTGLDAGLTHGLRLAAAAIAVANRARRRR